MAKDWLIWRALAPGSVTIRGRAYRGIACSRGHSAVHVSREWFGLFLQYKKQRTTITIQQRPVAIRIDTGS